MKSGESDSSQIQLLGELRKGDVKAFEAIFETYRDKIYAFSYKILKSRDLADELTINVFSKIWEKRASIQPNLAFQSYLFRIAKNQIINLVNKASLDSKLQDQLIVSSQYYRNSTEEEVIYNDYLSLAEQVLNKMPKQRRKVFRLRNEQGLTYEEIATELGISKNTVKSHLKVATAELRKTLNMYPEKTFLLLCVLLRSTDI
ncbi:RNA polymerase sigma-70 factor [Reichenbachiella sp. MALMAid0571]|uniref:RNA polymerase sigma factor n=1 Tax=Reichenbachiella sp. MALMAid0571 TaxID=3143939 RepID=UPI0032DF5242